MPSSAILRVERRFQAADALQEYLEATKPAAGAWERDVERAQRKFPRGLISLLNREDYKDYSKMMDAAFEEYARETRAAWAAYQEATGRAE